MKYYIECGKLLLAGGSESRVGPSPFAASIAQATAALTAMATAGWMGTATGGGMGAGLGGMGTGLGGMGTGLGGMGTGLGGMGTGLNMGGTSLGTNAGLNQNPSLTVAGSNRPFQLKNPPPGKRKF
jgi:nucleoporin p58/p45